MIFGRRQHAIVKGSLGARLTCLVRGGHVLYWNLEFGNLWCGECGGIWHLPTDPFS